MSVIVKNMGMPKRCLDCPFMVSRDNDDCILQTEVENELARTWEELKASCPLVEILTPHGRLIDADELIGKYGEWYTEEGTESGYIGTMKNLLKDAPTVIEAEGRKIE